MAKRFTDTEMWDKEWFMKLSCREKCLVNMVRSKADLCGVWSPNWMMACMYVGEKVCEEDLLKIDGGNQFKKLPNGKIYCIGFIEFQYGELSKKSPVHRKIISLLEINGLLGNYKTIGCLYPINRVQEEEEDKEEEEEEDRGSMRGNLLVPQMLKTFTDSNHDYPTDELKDSPALLEIAKFICEKAKQPFNVSDRGCVNTILQHWQHLCEHIPKDKFFKNYSISQVSKHIQSIVLSIQNGKSNSKAEAKSDAITEYISRNRETGITGAVA